MVSYKAPLYKNEPSVKSLLNEGTILRAFFKLVFYRYHHLLLIIF